MALGDIETGVEHLANAVAVTSQVFQKIIFKLPLTFQFWMNRYSRIDIYQSYRFIGF